MKTHQCPFCNRELTMEHKIIFIDYFCKQRDHFFCKRLVDRKDENGERIKDENGDLVKDLTTVKLSLRDHTGEKTYLKINYDEGNSQVWDKNSKVKRTTINQIFVPDYSDKEALLNKIKTYILFS